MFLLQIELIKCRFHCIRSRKLKISWIIDVLGSGSPYFFILLDRFTWIKSRKNQGTSLGKMGKHLSTKSETQDFRNFGNLSLPFFEFLNLRIPEFLIIINDEFLEILKIRLRDHSVRLRDHPNLMQGWESVCRLVIGIPLLENRKVVSIFVDSFVD